jgi:Uma2 family endonuclease
MCRIRSGTLTVPGHAPTIDPMATHTLPTRPWTRKEYDRLVHLGILHEDEPVELIGGQMIVAEPKGSPHMTALGLTADALRIAFGAGWVVREQAPIALDDESEPEPDIIVVAGHQRDYRREHPSRPALVVEIADSSLAFDRHHKGSVYARAGLPDYWIVNLRRRVLAVYRNPVAHDRARYGWKYADVRVLRTGAAIAPLAAPTASITLADLLP